MKPRTKLELEVIKSSENLLDREDELLPWAFKECLEHKGYATKTRVACMDCGNTFSPKLVIRKRAVCPNCNTKLKVEQTRKRKHKQTAYFTIAELYGEFQVIRNFELIAYYKTGEKVRTFCYEVLQHWINSNEKHTIVSRLHSISYYMNSWNGTMEIRKERNRNYYNSNKYDLYPNKIHPNSKFKPLYKMYGINHNLQGITPLEAIKIIPDNPKAETLLKAKQYSLLYCFLDNSSKIEYRWPSIKICIRNKYLIKDSSIWMDYLDLLQFFNKDLHNAKYVCPANLKLEHDRYVQKKRELQKLEDRKKQREKALKDEKIFQELKSKFFGIAFTDGLIKIKVLESVEEVMKEGDSLRHCVFTNRYHLRPDSLLLSASKDDKKLETIEISLSKLKVLQSRGACNQNTEHHDRIIKLVRKHIPLIRKRMKITE